MLLIYLSESLLKPNDKSFFLKILKGAEYNKRLNLIIKQILRKL
jgi:hypothetical protein